MLSTRWILTGNWDGTEWKSIISPNIFPHPFNEVNPVIISTSRKVGLVNGGEARISYSVKSRKDDITFSISALRSTETRLYLVGGSVKLYWRDIFNRLIENDISVRLQYQEYIGVTWTTIETFAGYFTNVGKTYKKFGEPQLYLNDINLQRFNVDSTGTY